MAKWAPPEVERLLCVAGGWSTKPIPIPSADVKMISAGSLGELTFVHVTMQKPWLLKCARRR